MSGNTLGDKPSLRESVLEALRNGDSKYAIAERFAISRATVYNLAKEEGIGEGFTPDLIKGALDYNEQRQREILNAAFERCNELLPAADTPQKMRELMTAIAIGVDKRRLIDGEATSRSEVNTGAARELLASRIAALNARRGTESDTSRIN